MDPSCSTTKRQDVLPWEDYFMEIALLSSKRSKDPKTQVGACIVGKNNKILGTGYNGFPRVKGNLKNDELFSWAKDEKNYYVVHAEVNAICNASTNVEGSKMYVTLFPCNECAKLITQWGIKEIYYLNEKETRGFQNKVEKSKTMFDNAGITYVKFIPTTKKLN